MRRRITPYLFILPAGAVIFFFLLYPLVYSFFISLHEWDLSPGMTFVGLGNYAKILSSPEFWDSMLYTAYYMVGVLPFSLVLGFLFASLLNDATLKGIGFFRTVYFLPVVTSPIAAGMGFSFLFSTELGYVNHLIRSMGGEYVNWLTNPEGIVQILFNWTGIQLPKILQGPSVALFVIILMGIWQNVGYAMVVYLAGMQGIPETYYEAASLSGATRFQCLRKITIPLLSPTTFFLLIMFSINSFQVFGPVMVMTPEGGPLNTTSVVVFRLYREAFAYYRFGYAAAMAFVLFIFVISMTAFQVKTLERRVHYE
ncbi:MAG TPA: sugar ABC transporter permease [Mesotoga infera]|jgi:multiple sugar transport system permease protein|nr:sugar ABC transporter permease [Mesotoga infera]HNS66930.1 sugar ABC transporter permease [Mesotoga infera]HOI34913.1 sugar ABC transporter permease [Mesotoga infera]